MAHRPRVRVPVLDGDTVVVALSHTPGGYAQSLVAEAMRLHSAPTAAAGGTAVVRSREGHAASHTCVLFVRQQSTPAVEARTTHVKASPTLTATTSPCSCGGTYVASEPSPQHVSHPLAFTAHALHLPAPMDTLPPCTLGGGGGTGAEHLETPPQQATVRFRDKAHVSVDPADSARTLKPAEGGVIIDSLGFS